MSSLTSNEILPENGEMEVTMNFGQAVSKVVHGPTDKVLTPQPGSSFKSQNLCFKSLGPSLTVHMICSDVILGNSQNMCASVHPAVNGYLQQSRDSLQSHNGLRYTG